MEREKASIRVRPGKDPKTERPGKTKQDPETERPGRDPETAKE